MFLVKARNFKQYKENLILFSVFSLIYFVRTKNICFLKNYQQDDISELRVSFYEDFICALNMGDNHTIIDIKNMDYFKNIQGARICDFNIYNFCDNYCFFLF